MICTYFAERADGFLQTGQRKGIKVTCFTDIFATLRHHSFNDYSLHERSYKRMSCSFVELTTQSSLPGIIEGVKYNPFSFFAPFTSRSITSEINQKATLVAIVLLHCTRICMANKAVVLKLVFSANPLVNPTSGFYTEGNTLVVHPPPKPPIICHISSTKSMANYIFMTQLCHLSISNLIVLLHCLIHFLFSQYILLNQCSHLVTYSGKD